LRRSGREQQRPCPFELKLQLGDTPIARDNVFLQLLQLALKLGNEPTAPIFDAGVCLLHGGALISALKKDASHGRERTSPRWL
jgi:hypothetical protein